MSGGFKNADFPMDSEGRTYHLMVKRGDVANRVLTVGDSHRAEALARYLDNPKYVRADRHFVTITGLRHGVPLTIVASLMGFANTDFVVREYRAVVDGPLYFVRFGTCGTPNLNCHIGDLAVGRDGVAIIRNPDAFRTSQIDPRAYYHITLPIRADPFLYQHMLSRLRPRLGDKIKEGTAVSGCSFYSSQGRPNPAFEDHNENLIERLRTERPETVSIEMETSHLYDLADVSIGHSVRSFGAAMIIADRTSKAFVTPAQKEQMVHEFGEALLDALADLPIPESEVMKGPECVWNTRN